MAFFGGFSHMDRLIRTVTYYGAVIHASHDDDFSDRLSHIYSAIQLITFSIIVSTKQYVGKPIVCWTPSHWTRNHQSYADHACWVSNTYWLPFPEEIPVQIPEREDRQISYYQWIPFALLIQSLFFYVPCLVWRSLNSASGIHLKNICEISNDMRNLNPESRKRTIFYLSRHLEMCLANQREYRSGRVVQLKQKLSKICCLVCGRRYGNYLTIAYMFTKLLYLLNVGGQLLFLNNYLQTNYTLYGVQILTDLNNDWEWPLTGHFPRVTMCDFVIRELGNKHRHTVQCVLPINMFNERIYIYIWFWYSGVLFITLYSFASWCNNLAFSRCRRRFIKKYLLVVGIYELSDFKALERFVNGYLRHDGVFCLRLLGKNAGDLVVTDLVKQLWVNFKKRQNLTILDGIVVNPKARANHHITNDDEKNVESIRFVNGDTTFGGDAFGKGPVETPDS